MEDIRNLNTSGLELYEREKLYSEVTPIEVGSVVYYSGGFIGPVEKITVDSKNQKLITMFWNSMYFENYDNAEKAHDEAYRNYIWSR